jgi:hypothetical protein
MTQETSTSGQNGQQSTPVVVGLGDPVMDVLFEMEPTVLASIAQKPGGCIPITHDEHLRLTAIAAEHCNPVRWVWSTLSAQLPVQLLLAAVEACLPSCSVSGQLATDSCDRLAR